MQSHPCFRRDTHESDTNPALEELRFQRWVMNPMITQKGGVWCRGKSTGLEFKMRTVSSKWGDQGGRVHIYVLNKGTPGPSAALGIWEVPYKYACINSLNASKRRWPGEEPDLQGWTEGGHSRKRSHFQGDSVKSKPKPGKPEPTILPLPHPHSPVSAQKNWRRKKGV